MVSELLGVGIELGARTFPICPMYLPEGGFRALTKP